MKCKYCNKKFKKRRGGNKHYKGFYCSISCYHKNRWGSTGKCRNCGKKTNQPIYCSEQCRKDYWNKNDYKLNKKQRNWERKFIIIKKLGGKCIQCGVNDIRILDIHHKDQTKKIRPKDKSYIWSRRLKDWEKNIDTIELLCANCHRIHTWKERGFGV
jgi:hypothetical protein